MAGVLGMLGSMGEMDPLSFRRLHLLWVHMMQIESKALGANFTSSIRRVQELQPSLQWQLCNIASLKKACSPGKWRYKLTLASEHWEHSNMNPLLWLMVFVKQTNKTMKQKLVICESLFPYFANYQFLFSCFIVSQITILCLLFHCFILQNHKPLAKHQSNKEGWRLDPNLHGNSINQSRIKVKCMWNKSY